MRNNTRFAVATAAVLIILLGSFIVYTNESRQEETFIILHSNDTHCHLDSDDSLGFSTLKCLRDQKVANGDTVFLVDAGDFLQGNAYGLLTEGEASVQVMNLIGYDVGIPGNHDFDYNLDVLLERASELTYPLICSNLVYKDSGESVFPEYLVLEKDGVRIGFFGLITPDTETSSKSGVLGNSTITDPYGAAERMVTILEGEDVDCIVALGHLGVAKSDATVTSDQVCSRVTGIDLFIDGHSHTEMEDGKVLDGSIELIPSDTVIASTGSYCKAFGVVEMKGDTVESAKLYKGEVMHDNAVDEKVEEVEKDVNDRLKQVIGTTEILLDGERQHVRSQETNMGDFLTDAIRIGTGSQIGFINGGSIRDSIQAGNIKLLDVYNVNPFSNMLFTMDVTGETVRKAIEFGLSKDLPAPAFMHVSGITVEYDMSKEPGSRVISIKIDGKDLDPQATYKVATTDFIAEGGDNNTAFVDYPKQGAGELTECVINYVKSLKNIDESSIEMGRLIAK